MDFESFIVPTADGQARHIPSGFCALRVSKYPQLSGTPYIYSEPKAKDDPGHVVKNMFEFLKTEEEFIKATLKPVKPMNLTNEEKQKQASATHCYGCLKSLQNLRRSN